MDMCLILNDYRESVVCGIDEVVHKIKLDTWYELLARISDVFASIKTREDQFRRTTRDLRTRVAKCTEVDSEICAHLL
jgi:hypothetical protein